MAQKHSGFKLISDIDTDGKKIQNLPAPASNGDAIRATTKITESNVEDSIDKKHEHSNKVTLDAIQEALTTTLKNAYDGAVTDSHTHANKSTLDNTEEAFTTTLKGKLDGIVNPMLFKGEINLATDFPTVAAVQNGWTYRIATDVTDNDASKTNTGQSFLADAEIAWNGSNWTPLGYSAVKSVAGKTGIVTLAKADVGLSNVDNTSDATKLTATKADVDIADAITKKHANTLDHTQGTDQKLDDGGVNEVTVANAKDAVDKKHSQNTDTELDNGGSNPITAGEIVNLETREKYADSPMIVTGGLISTGTNAGTFKVAAITSALLRTTASDTGELAEVTLAVQDNQAITLANTKYHVILNYGTPCTISIQTGAPNGQTAIGIGHVMKDNSNNVHFCNSGMRLQNGVAKLHKRATSLREIELASGCAIAYQAVREFTMTAGVIYEGINKFTPSVFDSAIGKFTYCYRDTDVWQYTADSTAIDDDYYDNNTAGKGAIGAQKYGCHWVYLHPDDLDVYVVYGRGNYTLAEAEAAQTPGSLPGIIADFGLLIGKIIIKKDATEFVTVQMVTDTFFVGTNVADHNELGNIQGGELTEYYHMNSAEKTAATRDATNAQNGLMPSGVKDGYDDAVTKKHTQNSDTQLGSMAANVNMNTHKLTGLSVPASNGDSIRATTKITEANLEDAVDKKHSQNTDTKILVNDTEVAITDTGVDGAISMKADNVVEATVTKDGFKLKAGADVNEISIDGTLAGNSDDAVPTEKAVKTYADAHGGVNPSSVIAVFERSASVTTGDGKADLVIPSTLNGMNLVRAQAVVITAGTTNPTTVAVYNVTDSVDMLSGNISIASGAKVGTVGTIDATHDDVATNDHLRIDVDAVSTTAPLGLLIILEFETP